MSDTWLSDAVKLFKDKNIAAVSAPISIIPVGYYNRMLGKLTLVLEKNREDFTPWMTNTNSLIRKDLWEKYHFDENLPGCEDYDWAKEMLHRGFNVVKYKPFSSFHSHFLLGRSGYFEMKPKWKVWNSIVDKKIRG